MVEEFMTNDEQKEYLEISDLAALVLFNCFFELDVGKLHVSVTNDESLPKLWRQSKLLKI